ncbi:hypothetical protein ACTA71_000122 [Dictyostelium dimigraforme]
MNIWMALKDYNQQLHRAIGMTPNQASGCEPLFYKQPTENSVFYGVNGEIQNTIVIINNTFLKIEEIRKDKSKYTCKLEYLENGVNSTQTKGKFSGFIGNGKLKLFKSEPTVETPLDADYQLSNSFTSGLYLNNLEKQIAMLKKFLIKEGYNLSSVDLSQMATLQNGPEFLSSSLQQLNNPLVRPQFSIPERLNYEQSLYTSHSSSKKKRLRRAIPSIQPVDEESNSTTDSVDKEPNSTTHSVDEELNSTTHSVDEELNSTTHSVDEELNSTTHSVKLNSTSVDEELNSTTHSVEKELK